MSCLLCDIPCPPSHMMSQNGEARVLRGVFWGDHNFPFLASLHQLPVIYIIEFKMILFTDKALHHIFLRTHLLTTKQFALTADLLVVSGVVTGGRAFCYKAPFLLN